MVAPGVVAHIALGGENAGTVLQVLRVTDCVPDTTEPNAAMRSRERLMQAVGQRVVYVPYDRWQAATLPEDAAFIADDNGVQPLAEGDAVWHEAACLDAERRTSAARVGVLREVLQEAGCVLPA